MENFQAHWSNPKRILYPFVPYTKDYFDDQSTDNEPVPQQTAEAYDFFIEKPTEPPTENLTR